MDLVKYKKNKLNLTADKVKIFRLHADTSLGLGYLSFGISLASNAAGCHTAPGTNDCYSIPVVTHIYTYSI